MPPFTYGQTLTWSKNVFSYTAVTVDGPSGAGKGTLCMLIAAKLGYNLLDSGAIYRVLALAAMHHGVKLESEDALVLGKSPRCPVYC